MLPMDCGEGSMNCPGWVDSMGCKTADSCVANGEECPFYCPNTPPTECGQGMMSCPGSVDGMGESRHLCLLRRGMSFLLSLRRPCGLRRGDDELPRTDGRDGMHDCRHLRCRRGPVPNVLN